MVGRVLVVEDEILIAETLRQMLLKLDVPEVVLKNDFSSALVELAAGRFDFVLLDVRYESQSKNGMDLARIVREKFEIPFAFVTSFSDKDTVRSMVDLGPVGFLSKPVKEVDLYALLLQVENERSSNRTIGVKDGARDLTIVVDDLLYIRADNVYLEIVTCEKTYVIRSTLKAFLEKNDRQEIQQVHRSYAVNLEKISAHGKNMVVVNDFDIPVSKTYQSKIFS